MDWHTDMFEDMQWYNIQKKKNDVVETPPQNRCSICGTRTGLHGFSFGQKGR